MKRLARQVETLLAWFRALTPQGARTNRSGTFDGGSSGRQAMLTIDGLWFHAACRELGNAKANELNQANAYRLGQLDMLSLQRRLPHSANQWSALELVRFALNRLLGSEFKVEVTEMSNSLHLEVKRCFACEGVKNTPSADDYLCGPGRRLDGWLSVLDEPSSRSPEVGFCQMIHTGRCSITVVCEKGRMQ